MSLIRRGLSVLALTVLFWVPLGSAQVQPIDCGTELYGSTNNGEVIAVSILDGSARLLSTLPVGAVPFGTEIEYDFASGDVWVESTNGFTDIVEIDPLTGLIEQTVTHGPFSLAGLEFVSGTLYSSVIALGPTGDGGSIPEQGDATFATFDLTTGVATPIGDMGVGVPVNGLGIHEASGVLYGITAGGQPANLVTVDFATGLATVVGATGYERIGSIEFGPDGELYGGTTQTGLPNPGALVRIDRATGAATLVGSTGFSITGLAACQEQFQPPEPAIPTASPIGLVLMSLLVAGAAVAVLLLRR